MAGLLYYVPDMRGDAEARKKAGIEDVFAGGGHTTRGVTGSGPDGGGGMIIVAASGIPEGTAPKIGYYPETQQWQQAPSGGYWVGRQTDEPTRPVDVQREEVVAGHSVTMSDGQEWLIPVARAFPQGSALPQKLRLGPDGELVAETLPKFAQFSAHADVIWDTWYGQVKAIDAGTEPPEPEITDKDMWMMAAEAISINYHIEQIGISLLGLIDTKTIWTVLRAVIDVPTILDAIAAEAKKNERPGDSSSATGPKD